MGKLRTIFLAILGGIDVTIGMFTPIILASLWVTVTGLKDWTSYFFYTMGLLATSFRAYKIGWLKNDRRN